MTITRNRRIALISGAFACSMLWMSASAQSADEDAYTKCVREKVASAKGPISPAMLAACNSAAQADPKDAALTEDDLRAAARDAAAMATQAAMDAASDAAAMASKAATEAASDATAPDYDPADVAAVASDAAVEADEPQIAPRELPRTGIGPKQVTYSGEVWNYLDESATGSLMYIGWQTVRTTAEGYKRGWFLFDESSNRSVKWRYSKQLFTFNCKERLVAGNAYVHVMANGQVVDSADTTINLFENVVPGGMLSAAQEAICYSD